MVKDNPLGSLTPQRLLLRMREMITGASSIILTHFLSKKHAGLFSLLRLIWQVLCLFSAQILRYSSAHLHAFFCYGVFNDLMRKMSKLTFLLPRSSHTTPPGSVSSVWHLWIYGKPHLCPHLKLGCTQMNPLEGTILQESPEDEARWPSECRLCAFHFLWDLDEKSIYSFLFSFFHKHGK